MTTRVLTLYVAGQSPRSKQAIANLQQICELAQHDEHETTIVDIVEQPELAMQNKILATPTLVRELPEPAHRIVGDLSDYEKVLQWLET